MQPGYYRAGGYRAVTWPGDPDRTVALAPLAVGVVTEADHEARAQWHVHVKGEPDHPMLVMAVQLCTLARALCAPAAPWPRLYPSAQALAAQLVPAACAQLYGQWEAVQEDSVPDYDVLYRQMLRDLSSKANLAVFEGVRAAMAGSATAFYGRPLDQLTEGHVCYFLALAAAQEKLHPTDPFSDGKTTMVSREWLERGLTDERSDW